jgi:hypothetical protein
LTVKDWLALGFSLVALGFSLISIVDRHKETQKATRRQVLDLIDDLNEINVEHTEPRKDAGTRYQSQWFRALNARREALTAMIESVLPSVPGGVTSQEYASIARSLGVIGDATGAEKYWHRALDAAEPESVYWCNAARGYALFLFDNIGDRSRGREFFSRAAEITKAGETDMARATTTDTYVIWALAEARADQNSDEINRLKESATESANAIQNRAYRILTNKKMQIGFGGQL